MFACTQVELVRAFKVLAVTTVIAMYTLQAIQWVTTSSVLAERDSCEHTVTYVVQCDDIEAGTGADMCSESSGE